MIGKWPGVYIDAQPKKSNGMKAAVDALGVWGFCGLLFYEGFLSKMRCSQVTSRH